MSGLATPLARTQKRLDALPARSVVIDRQGDAWQCGGVGTVGMFWYRAYGGEGMSSWEAAQVMGANVLVLKEGPR